MTGSSSSVVKTFPRFPSVKMVERFFNATLAEKMLEKKVKDNTNFRVQNSIETNQVGKQTKFDPVKKILFHQTPELINVEWPS